MLVRFILLWVILSGSAVWDLKEHRIPNWWLAAGFFACWLEILREGIRGVPGEKLPGVLMFSSVLYIGAVLVTLTFIFPLFLFRMMGAGDLKLIALVCGGLGPRAGLAAVGFGFCIGAVLALVKMCRQRSLVRRVSYFVAYFRAYFQKGEYFPYYVPARDGYGETLHFALCLWAGYAVYMITR